MPKLRQLQMRRVAMTLGANLRSGLFIGMVLAFAVLFVSAIAFWLFEDSSNPEVTGILSGFLWVSRTLFQGEPPFEPTTWVGHFLFYVTVIAGVGIIALVTGAVASKLIEWVMRKDSGMGEATYNDHIIICGWSPQGDEILRELHAEEELDPKPVVILAELEGKPVDDDLVTFVRGSPANATDLRRAGIDRAATAIILADRSNPTATADDQDARTLLTALAVESINPEVHTCVEVVRSENRAHFERTKADELIVTAELTGALLAGAASNHGISTVVADLTTHGAGQEFYRLPVPSSLVGRTFEEAMAALKQDADAILIGVNDGETDWALNPPSNTTVSEGAHLLVIAERDPLEVLEA